MLKTLSSEKSFFFIKKKKNSTEFIQIGKSSSAVIQQIDDTLLHFYKSLMAPLTCLPAFGGSYCCSP